jgi:hypothetical protein
MPSSDALRNSALAKECRDWEQAKSEHHPLSPLRRAGSWWTMLIDALFRRR